MVGAEIDMVITDSLKALELKAPTLNEPKSIWFKSSFLTSRKHFQRLSMYKEVSFEERTRLWKEKRDK